MEQSKTIGKSKIVKSTIHKKVQLAASEELDADLNLVIDNSLSKYANEAFIVEHAKKVDKKFALK